MQIAAAARTARSEPSNSARTPSPVVLMSRPRKRSSSNWILLVVRRHELAPARRTERLGQGGGVDDVGEQHGPEHALGLLVDPRERAHTGDVVGDERLVADDPAVVAGRDLEDHAGSDLARRAVFEPVAEPARDADADVVVLAEARPGDRLDVLQPVPARLERHPADHEVVQVVDVDPPERGRPGLVGGFERLRLETGHGSVLAPRVIATRAPSARGRVRPMMRHRAPRRRCAVRQIASRPEPASGRRSAAPVRYPLALSSRGSGLR